MRRLDNEQTPVDCPISYSDVRLTWVTFNHTSASCGHISQRVFNLTATIAICSPLSVRPRKTARRAPIHNGPGLLPAATAEQPTPLRGRRYALSSPADQLTSRTQPARHLANGDARTCINWRGDGVCAPASTSTVNNVNF